MRFLPVALIGLLTWLAMEGQPDDELYTCLSPCSQGANGVTGFVLLHRSLLGHPAFRNESETMAFAWMIAKASWKPARVRYKGYAVSLERGQLCVSQRDMAAAFDRDKAWIERLWKRLVCEAMIEARREAAAMVITICNYDKYQASGVVGEAASEALADPTSEAPVRQARGTEQIIEQGNKSSVSKDTSHSKRASGVPHSFQPEVSLGSMTHAAMQEWAPETLAEQIEKFIDHHTANDTKSKDWQASWRTWVKNWRTFNARRPQQRNMDGKSNLRGSRPDPALDMLHAARAAQEAESLVNGWGDHREAGPALPAVWRG